MSIIIKEMRTRTGMTQKEFAGRYGIPLSTLRKWEQGEASPPAYVVDLIAGTLPAENKALARIEGRSGSIYFYDENKRTFYDSRGNGVYASESIDGVKESNLGLYLDDLFDSLYEIQARFNRDLAYDKKEDILWI